MPEICITFFKNILITIYINEIKVYNSVDVNNVCSTSTNDIGVLSKCMWNN